MADRIVTPEDDFSHSKRIPLSVLGPDGWIKMESEEEKDARKRGPPYPWREGTEETYLKKVHEQIVAIFAAREGREALKPPLNEDR